MKSPDEIYVKLPRAIDAGADRQYDTLRLSVIHRHAGIDVTGKPYHAGHAISLTPCVIEGGFLKSTLLGADHWVSGFLLTLDYIRRKNPWYIARAMRVLEEMKDSIAVAFSERDGMALANIAALIHAGGVKQVQKAGA